MALALGLNSYQELLPNKTSKTDLVRVTYKESKAYSNKHKPDKKGIIKRKYKPITVVPLTEDEIEQWTKAGKPYLKTL